MPKQRQGVERVKIEGSKEELIVQGLSLLESWRSVNAEISSRRKGLSDFIPSIIIHDGNQSESMVDFYTAKGDVFVDKYVYYLNKLHQWITFGKMYIDWCDMKIKLDSG